MAVHKSGQSTSEVADLVAMWPMLSWDDYWYPQSWLPKRESLNTASCPVKQGTKLLNVQISWVNNIIKLDVHIYLFTVNHISQTNLKEEKVHKHWICNLIVLHTLFCFLNPYSIILKTSSINKKPHIFIIWRIPRYRYHFLTYPMKSPAIWIDKYYYFPPLWSYIVSPLMVISSWSKAMKHFISGRFWACSFSSYGQKKQYYILWVKHHWTYVCFLIIYYILFECCSK